MACNCKTVKNRKDIDDAVDETMKNKKLTFFLKLKIIFTFVEFYFYFVATSIINLMVNDKLEPSIPDRLIKKYNRY